MATAAAAREKNRHLIDENRQLVRKGRNQRLDTADFVRPASLPVLRDRRAKGLSAHPFY